MYPNRLHLGCGRDYRDGWHNVDKSETIRTDQRFDLADPPWPLPADTFEEIHAAHVVEHLPDVAAFLSECKRVLTVDGHCTIVVPIGENAVADPDHEQIWAWNTPLYYTGERHWDSDCDLSVVDRDVRLWSTLSGWRNKLHRAMLTARLETVGPGQWCFSEPYTGGEFEVVFA